MIIMNMLITNSHLIKLNLSLIELFNQNLLGSHFPHPLKGATTLN